MASNIQGAVNSMIGAAGQAATLFQLTPTGQEFVQKRKDTREFNRQMKINEGVKSNFEPVLNVYQNASPEDQMSMSSDLGFASSLEVAKKMVPQAERNIDKLNFNYQMKYGTPEEAIKVLTNRAALNEIDAKEWAEQHMSKSVNQAKALRARQKAKVAEDNDIIHGKGREEFLKSMAIINAEKEEDRKKLKAIRAEREKAKQEGGNK